MVLLNAPHMPGSDSIAIETEQVCLRCWRNFYFYFSRFRMIIDPPAAAAAINKNGLQRVNVLVDFFTQDLVMVISKFSLMTEAVPPPPRGS